MDIVFAVKRKYDKANNDRPQMKELRTLASIGEKRKRDEISHGSSLFMDKINFQCNQYGYDYFKHAIELDIFRVETVVRSKPHMFELFFRNKNIGNIFMNIRSDLQKLKTKIGFLCKNSTCQRCETCINMHESTLQNLYEVYHAIQSSYNKFLEFSSLKTASDLARDINRLENDLFFVVSRHHIGYCLFYKVNMSA